MKDSCAQGAYVGVGGRQINTQEKHDGTQVGLGGRRGVGEKGTAGEATGMGWRGSLWGDGI